MAANALTHGEVLSVLALRFDQPVKNIHVRLRRIQRTLHL